MKIDERIKGQFEDLISEGSNLIASARTPRNAKWPEIVDSQKGAAWSTRSLSLIERVIGRDSTHANAYRDSIKDYSDGSKMRRSLGILQAAHQDYLAGALFDLRRLIEAELFDDFLEQAEHLQGNGHFQVAAVVAGCVLEDGLRKLCGAQGIEISSKPKLDSMNADLAEAGVITKLEQKRVTVLADLRNKAAHGQWTEFDEQEVREMISSVRLFMERHFS